MMCKKKKKKKKKEVADDVSSDKNDVFEIGCFDWSSPEPTHVHQAFIFRDYWVWAVVVVGTCVVCEVPWGGEEEDGI